MSNARLTGESMASHFENDVITKWLTGSDEDRDMELTADFAFVEPTVRWEAPAGSVVNDSAPLSKRQSRTSEQVINAQKLHV